MLKKGLKRSRLIRLGLRMAEGCIENIGYAWIRFGKVLHIYVAIWFVWYFLGFW